MEGLHHARIHPKRTVDSLADSELLRLIDACRQYAMGWLRAGRAPPKNVYNETNCQTCHSSGSVRMVKLGNDLSRVTFWCESCQPFHPAATIGETPLSQESLHVPSASGRPVLVESDKNKNSNPRISANNPLSPLLQPTNKKITTNQHFCSTSKHACPQHGGRSFSIRRVRHKEHNKHRLFGTCRIPGCQFFVWADGHLPTCPTCHRKCILRVSKTERTSGRWFLSCSSTSSTSSSGRTPNSNTTTTKSCKGLFAWATPQHLEPLGKFLTPLL